MLSTIVHMKCDASSCVKKQKQRACEKVQTLISLSPTLTRPVATWRWCDCQIVCFGSCFQKLFNKLFLWHMLMRCREKHFSLCCQTASGCHCVFHPLIALYCIFNWQQQGAVWKKSCHIQYLHSPIQHLNQFSFVMTLVVLLLMWPLLIKPDQWEQQPPSLSLPLPLTSEAVGDTTQLSQH